MLVFLNEDIKVITPTLSNLIEYGIAISRPVSVVRMSDDKQVMVNKPMKDLLEMYSSDSITSRTMTKFWRPNELEFIKDRLLTLREFDHEYEAALSDSVWARMFTNFKLLVDKENNGEAYRVGTMLDEPIILPVPNELMIGV